MRRDDLVRQLDAYFRVPEVSGDARWYSDDDPYWRDYVEGDWVERRNGLMVRGADEVERAATCVFPSARIVDELEARTFLFAEHPVDLEDEPGFIRLSRTTFEAMRAKGISFYHVHGPLDQHAEVSPSRLLAEALTLRDTEEYFPIVEGIAGGAAVIGESDGSVDDLVADLRDFLGPEIPVRVVTRAQEQAGRVAVVGGGGGQREILEASLERGCETYVTGHVLTRCRLDFVQKEIAAFRALAEEAGVTVIDGTHYGTEKPPQLKMAEWFRSRGLPAEFVADGPK